MKFAVAILLFGSAALADDQFSCKTPAGFSPGDFDVAVALSGSTHQKSRKVTLTFKASYKVMLEGDPDTWSENPGFTGELQNNPDYDSKKYTSHLQFRIGNVKHDHNNFGDFTYILPKEVAGPNSPFMFKSYMIMTGVNGHMGTTAPLYCVQVNSVIDPTAEIANEARYSREVLAKLKSFKEYRVSRPQFQEADNGGTEPTWLVKLTKRGRRDLCLYYTYYPLDKDQPVVAGEVEDCNH